MIGISSLIRQLGTSLSVETLAAARTIISKAGLKAASEFFQNIPIAELKTLTRRELIDRFSSDAKQIARTEINDAVFTKSNARKLANILNGSIDFIENKTKQNVAKAYANLYNRKIADTLKALSTPGFGTPGKEGIDVLGIEIGGKFITGKVRSAAYNKARDAALETLRLTIVPKNKVEAFAVAYVRGFFGEVTGTAVNSLLVATPRAVLGAPKARAFFRVLQAEVEFLRQSGQVKTASQLKRALVNATAGARDVYGTQEGLITPQIAGYVSGRLTLPVATTYVFVDGDERKANIEKFQRTVLPFAKKEIKIWIDSYIREDGTRVKGHYRQVEVAA